MIRSLALSLTTISKALGYVPVNPAAAAITGGTIGGVNKLTALAATSATTLTLPANCYIQNIFVKNNTANAVTGGLKFGSTLGGVDIVAALAVGANGLVGPLTSAILLALFSTSATQTIYVDAVAAWNSANVDITVVYGKLS